MDDRLWSLVCLSSCHLQFLLWAAFPGWAVWVDCCQKMLRRRWPTPQPPAHRLLHMPRRHDSKQGGAVPEDLWNFGSWLILSHSELKTHGRATASPKSQKLFVRDKIEVWKANNYKKKNITKKKRKEKEASSWKPHHLVKYAVVYITAYRSRINSICDHDLSLQK